MRSSNGARKKRKQISDSKIDLSDIPELDEHFWKRAKLVVPEPKESISLRVDADVLRWFKARGKGYQSLMNAVLRSFVEMTARENKRGKRG